jgi:hypothetical protein
LSIIVCLAFSSVSVFAFGLPSLPSLPSLGSSSGGVDPAGFVKETRNALYSYAKSEAGLASALGGYTDLAAQQKLLEGLKVGDAAADKDQIETLITIHKSASEAIDKKMAENTVIDSKNKKLAAKSTAEYVKALIATTKLVASGQGLAKNPIALGLNAGSVLYAVKNLPAIIKSGTSNTVTLFKYLSANGVDVSEAKEAANGLGT